MNETEYQIPFEILENILSFASVNEVLSFALLNKTFYEFSRSNKIWKPLFYDRWPQARKNMKIANWFQFYLKRKKIIESKNMFRTIRDEIVIENCHWEYKCPLMWVCNF